MITIKNFKDKNDFINAIINKAGDIKIIRKAIDGEKKNINDLFTESINNFYSENEKSFNNFFINVYKIFGNYDSFNLNPSINNTKTIPEILMPNKTKYNGYFIFKGGNIIKYWTIFKYFKKLGQQFNNLHTLLTKNLPDINDQGAVINYSDFDFTYYLGDLTIPIYKDLLKHTMDCLFILRNNLEDFVKKNNTKLSLSFRNLQLHYEIAKSLSVPNKNYKRILKNTTLDQKYEIDINLPDNTIDNLLTFENGNFTMGQYIDNSKHCMNLSYNNCIVTNTGVDFDLFRIKLNLNANNNYQKTTFKAEVFDLTIIRPDINLNGISHREEFCEHANDYTIIVSSNYNNQQLNIRCYNIEYTLKDLLSILFISNQPYNSIFPWIDKKYGKRAIRLGLLISEYTDIINNNNNRKLNYIKLLFLERIITSFIKKWDIFLYKNLSLEDKIREFKMIFLQLTFIKYFNFILKKKDSLIDEISNIITNNIQNINYYRKFIEEKKYIDFLIIIILLFIRKIIVEFDIDWCKDGIIGNYDVNMCNFQNDLLKFITTIRQYFILGIINLTTLIENDDDDYYIDLLDLLGGRDLNNPFEQTIFSFNKNNLEDNNKNNLEDEISFYNKIFDKTKIKEILKISKSNKIQKNDRNYFSKLQKIKKSLETNYYLDEINSFDIITLDKDNKIINTVKRYPKLIKSEIYNDDDKMNNLIKEHAKFLLELFEIEETEMINLDTDENEIYI